MGPWEPDAVPHVSWSMILITGCDDYRLGRKYMCMLFCGTYTLSCLATALCGSPLYLLIGRVLGGFSTSILYSAFESWMVTEWTTRAYEGSGINLSYLFGILTQANSVTAIVAGVVSEFLVEKTGTLKSPFLVACVLLPLAACIIGLTWVRICFPCSPC